MEEPFLSVISPQPYNPPQHLPVHLKHPPLLHSSPAPPPQHPSPALHPPSPLNSLPSHIHSMLKPYKKHIPFPSLHITKKLSNKILLSPIHSNQLNINKIIKIWDPNTALNNETKFDDFDMEIESSSTSETETESDDEI